MSFLPISLNLAGKQIGLIGGGQVAAQKLKSLVRYSSNIRVIAPEIAAEIESNPTVQCLHEAYQPQHIEGLFLVFACTDSPEINAQIQADCESRGILCNRTDDAAVSDFHSSALVETDDFVVALNSKRKEVKKTVLMAQEIEHFVREREQLLQLKEQLTGKVFLVGFGPGNPNLLSRRGEQLLFQADIIFYDDLLDHEFLARYRGEKHYVGKRRGNHSKEQDEINELIYQAAQSGQQVVRLKGGDPLIFGRGSEERFYLEERGVAVEFVPGISSAIAAASLGDIPLTHRGIASSVSFGTAHGKNSYEIPNSDTAVYYMGASHMHEIATNFLKQGYPDDYPVGLVYKASFHDQQVTRTTIGQLSRREIAPKSPVIGIFGNTVNYRKILNSKIEQVRQSKID
ncbi:uroporphyrinogen-III C-methyltransferase [Mangrovibacterium lignilyticum]|uniref:uroporphyrinogen-III C-methyltransferase n=1 Tax=Mangrovibacterium lignilyticum TaxID=2668052 RepID=UPI0013D02DD7|nr:uroporphyrinogen-III C-methyltransferase [Mangrovibacterium lignilyticum]